LVRIEEESVLNEDSAGSSVNRYPPGIAPAPAQPPSATTDSSLNKPTIAVVAVVAILAITGLVLLIGNRSSPKRNSNLLTNKQQRSGDNDNTTVETSNDATPLRDDGDSNNRAEANNSTNETADLSAIEARASRVLTGISRDTHPVLTEKPLTAINA